MPRKPAQRYKWKVRVGRPNSHAKDGKRILARGKPLRVSASAQAEYTNAIGKLVREMIAHVNAEIVALFQKDFAHEHFGNDAVGMDAGISSQTRILMNALKKKYDGLFGKAAPELSKQMTDRINQSSFTDTRASLGAMPHLRDEGDKLTIDLKSLDKPTLQLLKAETARAADFIQSIPERYLNSVADATYRSITSGEGLKDLQEHLQRYDAQTQNWAHNTAMDQTRKTYNGLNLGRMKKIGVTKGEWIHSGGSQHPRELHEAFDGHTFDLEKGAPVGDDDGDDVQPGEEPNCRCTFVPVLTDDEEKPADREEDEE